MTSALLALNGVGRSFGREPTTVRALQDASFDVAAGEAVAIIGRSGSGKSTLLNVLGLLDVATEGGYGVAGAEVTTLSEHDRTILRATFFGFVFQQSFLLATRTAQENVEVPLQLQGVSRRERRRRAREALDSVGLGERARFLPRAMSGGENQRVAIARAIAHKPRVLLCDEPTGNLDERTSRDVLGLLRESNGAGATLIMVTHDLALARSFPRILSVRDGRVSEGSASFLASESSITSAGAAQP